MATSGKVPWRLKSQHVTLFLACLTGLLLVYVTPGSLRDDFRRGGVYILSYEFMEDIPKRFTGPGRLRFVLQPLTAIILGILNGIADARADRPPYVWGILFHRHLRFELIKTGFYAVVNVVLMGILMDLVCQWIILGIVHPGAALVLGPVLIVLPYAAARAFSNRLVRLMK